jgi:hypothetical protein
MFQEEPDADLYLRLQIISWIIRLAFFLIFKLYSFLWHYEFQVIFSKTRNIVLKCFTKS